MSHPPRLCAAVSTSSSVWSAWVGAAWDDPRAGMAQIDGPRGRPRNLLAALDRLLADRGATLADVGRFALDVGPGSFTGLRSGMAAVRALAWALDVPVCAVPAWHAMARAANPPRQVGVLCAIRARTAVWYLARWPDVAPCTVAVDHLSQWLGATARPGDVVAGTAWSDPHLVAAGAEVGVAVEFAAGDCDAARIAAVALLGPGADWAGALQAQPCYVAASEAENRLDARAHDPPPKKGPESLAIELTQVSRGNRRKPAPSG
ncbi:MAG: tRNA (adenosine(37)-N6)-threonylcarbamoyltransferase complex dimerization subunit type 1 TsaB [Deltaproteobacteria bacterium]|nr:tRNA (adenosine(37)-N6)-threonylcarbamoyltransferase complex dimerization subunit type 1 TsaB [Deltaproteobacteria bacterium]